MKLSNQALGAIMLALQKALMEQSDITEVLKGFDFLIHGPSQSELIVANPPIVELDQEGA
tara:strand:+ start:2198 stop:2377 length:180 start_codon:yes stop_codon:yes gene_type:complete